MGGVSCSGFFLGMLSFIIFAAGAIFVVAFVGVLAPTVAGPTTVALGIGGLVLFVGVMALAVWIMTVCNGRDPADALQTVLGILCATGHRCALEFVLHARM